MNCNDTDQKIVISCWNRWMSKRTASLYCDCSVKTIERWIATGKLPYSRVNDNGHLRIDKNDLDKFLNTYYQDKKENRARDTLDKLILLPKET